MCWVFVTQGPVGDIEVEECFGIFLHPCAETTQLSVYIELLEPTKTSFQQVFTGNDSAVIPGEEEMGLQADDVEL